MSKPNKSKLLVIEEVVEEGKAVPSSKAASSTLNPAVGSKHPGPKSKVSREMPNDPPSNSEEAPCT